MTSLIRFALFALLLLSVRTEPLFRHAAAAEPLHETKIAYLGRAYDEPLPLSLVEPIIRDKGIQGARLALKENQTTGDFLGRRYTLVEKIVPRDGDVVAAAKELLSGGNDLIVADLEPADLLAVADLAEAKTAIIINARSSSDALRGENCRRNVFHTPPSWAMRADALSQYMVWKKWKTWFLIRGTAPEDTEYETALVRSAKKFGIKIAGQRTFDFSGGNRRTDSGHEQIQAQIPLLTQSPPDHDIVVVADVADAFGEYLLWRTSVPKPVAGTHGLIAVSWHRSYEQYGGTQLQNRFEAFAKRSMTERDYFAWLAVRIFGEAVTRSGAGEADKLRAYLVSPAFEVAGFKGGPMSFRTWDRQLRQPMLLTGPRSLVSMSPQEGFLHQKFITDTLGFDEPESRCQQRG